jgi:hypothetical protein
MSKMKDKKLTDSEIPNVKELLEYKVKGHCELCDFKNSDCCSVCMYTAIKQFIELFNHLQAENENLKIDIATLEAKNFVKDKLLAKAEAKLEEAEDTIEYANKELKKAEAENERFKNIKNAYDFAEYRKQEIKADAYKEFWEELKRRNTMDERIVSVATGDNLLNEMVGDNETVL